ncbi:hypothetical protein PF049_03125 [Erythrobacteraceae bacterium WH01K]|nr:hypothetical protein PF049_03125 [Erythrobacteraceae bacterium WH01K]
MSTLPLADDPEKRRLRAYLVFILLDVAILIAAFAVSGVVREGRFAAPAAMMQGELTLPLFLTIALYNRVYSMRAIRRAFAA